MFDDGEVHLDTNASLGESQDPQELHLETLHVQDRGILELHAYDKENGFNLAATNITVSGLL